MQKNFSIIVSSQHIIHFARATILSVTQKPPCVSSLVSSAFIISNCLSRKQVVPLASYKRYIDDSIGDNKVSLMKAPGNSLLHETTPSLPLYPHSSRCDRASSLASPYYFSLN